ncbi:uncharacterized protein FIBRA_06356 [Fibroporia radiculosa]|uniref:Arrestin C-terminal-like domain-containing protein n=1 Tax=Fibroporia radiculosa TaxID=599839 RepID=J4GSL1_9APHY|nr:uncharacterized protein FIBRA_06356 [Fibroporia radiculosa]CCM04190.1 predicted protein [Fibroporia radiculosa]
MSTTAKQMPAGLGIALDSQFPHGSQSIQSRALKFMLLHFLISESYYCFTSSTDTERVEECLNSSDRIATAFNEADKGAFIRSETLFDFQVSQTRNTTELKALLGNGNARLKSGAAVQAVLDTPGSQIMKAKRADLDTIRLEQSKHKARLEADIILDNNIVVQGGHLRGHIKLRVRKRSKKEAAVLLSDGKIRVVGFECIPGQDDRHTFFQCVVPLSQVAEGVHSLYSSPPNPGGFAPAMEGAHVFPFSIHIPSTGASGTAKGVLHVHSGIAVQYIAMISMKMQNPNNGKRSIAHFYRNCEVWPQLNPAVVLASAPRPLQAATSKGLSVLGNSSKVKMTALLHRLTWIAGQRCSVSLVVVNETKKTIRSLALTLIRTTTIFRPKPMLDAGPARSADPDACQTTTMHKVVSESVLEMAQRGVKGHASAKGWWTGVAPGQELSFSHYVLLPPDALSVARGRLLEVEYSIRVTLSAGPLTSDVHVTLPIRIINFLSIDSNPSDLLHSMAGAHVRPLRRRRSIDGELDPRVHSVKGWSMLAHGLPDSRTSSLVCSASRHKSTLNPPQRTASVEGLRSPGRIAPASISTGALRITNPDRHPSYMSGLSNTEDEDSSAHSSNSSYSSSVDGCTSSSEPESSQLEGGISGDSDSDEEVHMVLNSAAVDEEENGSELTIAGPEYGSCASRVNVPRPTGPRSESYLERGRKPYRDHSHSQYSVRNASACHASSENPGNIEGFSQRVHERLTAITTTHSDTVSRIKEGDDADNIHHLQIGCDSEGNAGLEGEVTPKLGHRLLLSPLGKPVRPARNPSRRCGVRAQPIQDEIIGHASKTPSICDVKNSHVFNHSETLATPARNHSPTVDQMPSIYSAAHRKLPHLPHGHFTPDSSSTSLSPLLTAPALSSSVHRGLPVAHSVCCTASGDSSATVDSRPIHPSAELTGSIVESSDQHARSHGEVAIVDAQQHCSSCACALHGAAPSYVALCRVHREKLPICPVEESPADGHGATYGRALPECPRPEMHCTSKTHCRAQPSQQRSVFTEKTGSTATRGRPVTALYFTGISENDCRGGEYATAVKGRIAELEERVRGAQGDGNGFV